MIKIKRIYETREEKDGFRILVDRLWPRGISKEKTHVDLWLKEIAPSNKLRKWFSHDPKKLIGFKSKYKKELENNPLLHRIKQLEKEKCLRSYILQKTKNITMYLFFMNF